MKAKTKGKAIIGILLAAIMLASVMVAMLPTVSAEPLPPESYSGLYNNITLVYDPYPIEAVVSVLIGQDIWFVNGVGSETIRGDPASDTVSGEFFTADATGKFDTSAMTKPGIYYVNATVFGTNVTACYAKLAVSNPVMSLDLKSGGKSVSSITVGTLLEIDFTSNLNGKDMVSLVITDPDGNTIKQTTNPTQYFDKINVSYLTTRYGGFTGTTTINTTGWKLGTYKFKVATKKNFTANLGARGLEMSSNEKTLTVLKAEVSISADKTSVAELERVILTVTGVPGHSITISSSDWSRTTFPGGCNDNPSTDMSSDFTKTIDADGKRTFVVYFNDTWSYTITVTDNTAMTTDTVDISVSERAVTFDVPTTVVVGEKLTVKGTANTGDFVTVAVEDTTYSVLERLVIDENGEFSKEIDTGTACGGKFAVPGSVRLKAYIDAAINGDGIAVPATWTDDGTTVLLMTRGGLTAELSATSVAHEDDFTVSGTAKGSKSIDIVIVAPKGGGGSLIEPGASTLPDTNIYHASTSVSEIDDTFSKRVTVGANVDNGSYLVVALSKGSDDKYGLNHDNLTAALAGYTLTAKTQEQILIIIEDATFGAAGSDDLYWVGYINVGSAFLTLNPIASVASGEPLIVTGTTNRKEGFAILVTVKGPVHLTPQTVTITKGTFSATFDTTDAPAGTYTVKADDGDGHTDTKTVEILPALTPTSMRLHEHWNFISVPKKLTAGNDTFEQVFDTVNTSGSSIFYYNITEGWRAVTATEEVKPLRGYWIYSANDTVLNLTYDTYPLRTPPTRPLYKGWNAIGFSDITAAATNSALTSIEKSWAYLLGFNAATQEYESGIINNDET
ncbi:MAG: hypothetical protein ISS94_05770, partial [Candidatus Syntrophoarchaeum sp.]|nr:hypothetical protein [Candidatus Syntrophoarchaeum sp.]